MFAALTVGSNHWALDVLFLLLVPALIILNGLCVAAEFALVAVRKTRMEELAEKGTLGAQAVLHTLEHLDNAIAATQLGITLTSIGLGMISEPALVRLVEPWFFWLPAGWDWVTAHGVASVLALVLITYLHVVFGELIPKSIALQMPDHTAMWLARPLMWFAWLSRPALLAMNGTGNWLLHLVGFRGTEGQTLVHSVEELILLVEDTEEAGLLEEDEADLVENVFLLRNKRVADCMVPRERMAALEISTSPDKVLEAARSGAHTRMPVYEGELDNIVGIVNTKDLFYLFSLNGVVVLHDALYVPTFLDPEESISTALRLFKKAHRHMALVRDDEGHILGLLTLEDIVEEIVGELEDEHDRPMPKVRRLRRPPTIGGS